MGVDRLTSHTHDSWRRACCEQFDRAASARVARLCGNRKTRFLIADGGGFAKLCSR